MSRLYDRILRGYTRTHHLSDRPADINPDVLLDAQVIVADEVARYYYEGTDQEEWVIATDFPNIAPPFERFFIEWKAPKWIVSEEHGLIQWDADRYATQGFLFEASRIDLERDYQELVADIPKAIQTLTISMESSQETFVEQFKWLVERGDISAEGGSYEDLPDWMQMNVSTFKRQMELLAALEAGDHKAIRNLLQETGEGIEDDGWTFVAWEFMEFFGTKKPYGPVLVWNGIVRGDGSVATRPKNGDAAVHAHLPVKPKGKLKITAEQANTYVEHCGSFIHPALLTLSFLHCKNTALKQVEPPVKVSRKHHRKHGHPLTKYYTLEIEPMKEVLSTKGRAGVVGLKKAIHICRGHFATYSPEKPLFGKHTGTYWKPQHIRGAKESGEIVKDYAVKAPK